MLRHQILLMCPLLLLPMLVSPVSGQPTAKDLYGDPLPDGAVARLGSARLQHGSSVVFGAFLPGGKRVLSITELGVLHVWELPEGKPLHRVNALVGPSAQVNGATLSPNGKLVTAFGSDGYLHIWDWAKGKEIGKIANKHPVAKTTASSSPFSRTERKVGAAQVSTVYSPDGKTLMLYGASKSLQLVDLSTGKEIGPSQGHIETPAAIWFTPDGKTIMTKDQSVTHSWDAATGRPLGVFSAAPKLPNITGSPTIVSPDGKYGVTVERFSTPTDARNAKSRKAFLFDAVTGKELATIHLEVEITPLHIKPPIFSPDGKLLASSTGDAQTKINLYEIPSGKLLRTVDVTPAPAAVPPAKRVKKGIAAKAAAQPGGVLAPARGFRTKSAHKMLFSPDGKAIAFQSDPRAAIVMLNTATGKPMATLPADGANLHGIFSPTGHCLAVELDEGMVTLYELATGQPRFTFGSKLPAAAAKPKSKTTFSEYLRGADNDVRANVAISPDGKLLALPGPNGAVCVWSVVTGSEVKVYRGHTGPVTALAFSPDGKTLASASADATALLWDVSKIEALPLPAQAEPAELEEWWQAMLESDGSKAFTAMGRFAGAPKQGVAWIKKHVKPATVDLQRVETLIKLLDHDQFKVRVKADAELLQIGEPALPAIEKALSEKPSLEVQQRLEDLRAKLSNSVLQGDRLRAVRAVELLQFLGTPEARQLLQSLANGAPGAVLTMKARAALRQ